MSLSRPNTLLKILSFHAGFGGTDFKQKIQVWKMSYYKKFEGGIETELLVYKLINFSMLLKEIQRHILQKHVVALRKKIYSREL